MSDTTSNDTANATVPIGCKHLRTKKMYIPAEYPEPGRLTPSDTAHYWCLCTAREIGPDGQLVHLDTCNAGRGCCDGH